MQRLLASPIFALSPEGKVTEAIVLVLGGDVWQVVQSIPLEISAAIFSPFSIR